MCHTHCILRKCFGHERSNRIPGALAVRDWLVAPGLLTCIQRRVHPCSYREASVLRFLVRSASFEPSSKDWRTQWAHQIQIDLLFATRSYLEIFRLPRILSSWLPRDIGIIRIMLLEPNVCTLDFLHVHFERGGTALLSLEHARPHKDKRHLLRKDRQRGHELSNLLPEVAHMSDVSQLTCLWNGVDLNQGVDQSQYHFLAVRQSGYWFCKDMQTQTQHRYRIHTVRDWRRRCGTPLLKAFCRHIGRSSIGI